jgi:hypothetical protein
MEIDASEVKKLRKELKRLRPDEPEWEKRFGQINKRAGDIVVEDARRRAAGMGAQRAKAARAIKSSTAKTGIRVRIAGGAGVPFALGAFWGAKKRTGWYARARYRRSTGRQFDRWVGNTWEVGGPGGPYALNPAIRAQLPKVLDTWGDEVVALMEELNIR